jgi:integrase
MSKPDTREDRGYRPQRDEGVGWSWLSSHLALGKVSGVRARVESITRNQPRDFGVSLVVWSTLKGKRDYVIIALLVGCALRRRELATLNTEDIQGRVADGTTNFGSSCEPVKVTTQ